MMNKVDEIHVLYNSLQFIDKIINNDNIQIVGQQEKQVVFHTRANHLIFYICLLDIIKKNNNSKSLLDKIMECESLDKKNGLQLKETVGKFQKWLNCELTDSYYSYFLGKELEIDIDRYTLIYICANFSKHSVQNLSYVSNKLKRIINRKSEIINDTEKMIITKEFYDYYNEHILIYHASMIVKHLVDIRWEIHYYLKNLYDSSFIFEVKEKYNFNYPKEISTDIDQYIFWELMNIIRNEPYINKFEINKYLTMRY